MPKYGGRAAHLRAQYLKNQAAKAAKAAAKPAPVVKKTSTRATRGRRFDPKAAARMKANVAAIKAAPGKVIKGVGKAVGAVGNYFKNTKMKPGDGYNAFQQKVKASQEKIKSAGKPFVPTYGGKVGGKMSDGSGWGGEPKQKVKGSFKKGGKVKSTGLYKLHKGEKVVSVKKLKKMKSKKKK